MIRVVRDVEELLRTAVLLYHMVAPELSPTAHDWLASRWQAAARKQWVVLRTKWQQNIVQQQREQAALRDMRKQAQQQGYASDSKLVKVYRSVQYVCQLMQEDLSFALALKNLDGLLPATPELPQATAEFYCQQFLSILRITLRWYPPLLPTEPAVDLLVSVARMQT
ncbi:uncharacterized protein HaLaN_20936, partial [Haematococcus lacustris]